MYSQESKKSCSVLVQMAPHTDASVSTEICEKKSSLRIRGSEKSGVKKYMLTVVATYYNPCVDC